MAYKDEMSAYDAEKLDFEAAFGKFKDKRLAIYGIGRMSATLLPELGDYRIVGLLDRDSSNWGKVIYGYPVLSVEEAEKEADLVIINTAESYWNVIWNRISGISIPVYFKNGVLAKKEEKEIFFQNLPYWNGSYEKLQKEVLECDIVSFDIFDTLLMRTAMDPIDMFHFIEKQEEEIFQGEDFFELRKKASAAAGENATLTDIYSKLQLLGRLSHGQAAALKARELIAERKNFRARKDMVCLLQKAVEKRKEVYLISDMYMESDYLAEVIYELAGVKLPRSCFLISSERKKQKKDGTLWKEYADRIKGRGKAIHIGDDKKADEIEPRKMGIGVYRIWKANEMLANSSLADIRSLVCNPYESLLAGHIMERLFNSPFALNQTKGKVQIDRLRVMGYCVLGPVIYIFLKWLLEQAEKKGICDYLFVARDGWFLLQDYEYLVGLSEKKNAPKGYYLGASRRLVSAASIRTEDDFEKILLLPYRGTFSQLMEKRFNVRIKEGENANKMISLPADAEMIKKLSFPYMAQIMTEMKEERENYQKYLEQFPIEKATAVVDFCYHGTIQYYLQKIIGKRLDGYYFFADISSNNPYCRENMFPCFQDESDKEGKESEIYKKWILIESFLTAPHGMIQYVDKNGEFVYGRQGRNQIFFQERIEINEGVKEFIRDMVKDDVDRCLSADHAMIRFVRKAYGCMMEGDSVLGAEIRKYFYFDNDMVHDRELNIFE